MLEVINLSSLNCLFWGNLYNDMAVGELSSGRTPYTISYPVSSGDKDIMGNRDASHFQVHGRIFALAPESTTRSRSRSNTEPPDTDTWFYPCGESGPAFYQLAVPGHPYFWGRTFYYGDKRVPSYKIVSAYIDKRVAYFIEMNPRLRWSSWPTDNYFGWSISGACAKKAGNGWWSACIPDLDLSDIGLPEGFTWENAVVQSQRKYDYPSRISADLVIDSDYDHMVNIPKDNPKLGEMLCRDIFARLVIQIRNSLSYDKDPYCRPYSYYTSSYFEKHISIRRLSSSWLSSLKTDLQLFAIGRKPRFDTRFLRSRATQSAADAARDFSGNTGMLIKELVALKGSLVDLYKLLQGDVSLKNVSSLYLNGKYGLRLTAQDTSDLVQSVVRELRTARSRLYSTARGSASSSQATCHCKLYYDLDNADAFSKSMYALQSWDLFPSLENVWDIIPYSFVIDWFADIEGFLQAIDTRTFMSTMNIFRVLYSEKVQWEVLSSELAGRNLSGSFKCTYYTRWSQKEADTVIPSFSGGNPSDHIIEGSALIIQRFNK